MSVKAAVFGIARFFLAAVFIVSGFLKAVDPWGTAIKLGEYFSAFALEAFAPARYVLSIALSSGEMLLGFCLLFRLGWRFTSRIMFWVMLFFTLLTLILAIWNPVSDCGCFGDAFILTNWQTFFKNLILLLFAVIVLSADRPSRPTWLGLQSVKSQEHGVMGWALGLSFLLFSAGIGLYSLRHLPLIDFLPYQAGKQLITSTANQTEGVPETKVVYRHRVSGESREFRLSDTTWQDSLRWEFVESRSMVSVKMAEEVSDFAILSDQGDVAQQLLGASGPWFLLTLTDLETLNQGRRERYEALLTYARIHSIPIYGVTPAKLPRGGAIRLGKEVMPLYNIDATLLKTLIRTRYGAILLQDGTILAKWNVRDVPDFKAHHQTIKPLSFLAQQPGKIHLRWFLGVSIVTLFLIYCLYFYHRGRSY